MPFLTYADLAKANAEKIAKDLEKYFHSQYVEEIGSFRYTETNHSYVVETYTPEYMKPVYILVSAFEDGSIKYSPFSSSNLSELDRYESLLGMDYSLADDKHVKEMIADIEDDLEEIDRRTASWDDETDVEAWLVAAGIDVVDLQIKKSDLPKAMEVLAGRFKESLTRSMTLELLDPKHKGTTDVELSVYTSMKPADMIKDPNTLKIVKKGLGAIYSKSVATKDRIGLLVKKAIDGLMFRLHDPGLASMTNSHAGGLEMTPDVESLWDRYCKAWKKDRKSEKTCKLSIKIKNHPNIEERDEMFHRMTKLEEYGL